MYVCICEALTEKDIKKIIDDKHCHTTRDVVRQCGAGKKCGKCLKDIEKLVYTEQQNNLICFV